MSEAAARLLHLYGATGRSRTEMFEGREHLVVPVVALMEGVIHAVNAENPEYVPARALGVAPQSWDGRPLMLGHPAKDGRQISANDARVLESQSFGRVFNTRFDGRRLLMDAYIDPVKTERIGGGEMLRRLRNNELCEVSVGAFVTTDPQPGQYNGKPYKAVWNSISPDHLAFLPQGRGACSAEMGCGANRAAVAFITAEGYREVTPEDLKAAAETTHYVPVVTLDDEGGMRAWEIAADDALKILSGKGSGNLEENTDGEQHKDCEACEGSGEKDGKPCDTCKGSGKAPSKNDGDMKSAENTAGDAPAAAVKVAGSACGCRGEKNMTKEQRAETISTLIACKHSGFTEGDQVMLENATDERLEAFKVASEARMRTEADMKAAAAKPMTEEEFMANAPASLRSLITRQQQQETSFKAELVAELKAAQEEYSETELAAMPIDQLQRMARMARIELRPDFSGRGLPRVLSNKKQDDVYANPPDPYAEAIKQRQSQGR